MEQKQVTPGHFKKSNTGFRLDSVATPPVWRRKRQGPEPTGAHSVPRQVFKALFGGKSTPVGSLPSAQAASYWFPTVTPKQGKGKTDTPPQRCAWDPS